MAALTASSSAHGDELQRALARIEQLEKDAVRIEQLEKDVVKHLHSNGGEQCIPGVQDLFRSARDEGGGNAKLVVESKPQRTAKKSKSKTWGFSSFFGVGTPEGSAGANQSTFGVGTPKGVSARKLCPLVYGTTAKDVKLNPIYLEPLKAKGRPPHGLTSQR